MRTGTDAVDTPAIVPVQTGFEGVSKPDRTAFDEPMGDAEGLADLLEDESVESVDDLRSLLDDESTAEYEEVDLEDLL